MSEERSGQQMFPMKKRPTMNGDVEIEFRDSSPALQNDGSCQASLADFCRNTTFHGLRYLVDSNSWINRYTVLLYICVFLSVPNETLFRIVQIKGFAGDKINLINLIKKGKEMKFCVMNEWKTLPEKGENAGCQTASLSGPLELEIKIVVNRLTLFLYYFSL